MMDTGCVQHPGQPVLQGGPADKYREDSRHGLPPLLGSREPVGSSVREDGHRGRAHIQRSVEGTGVMRRMQRVVGGGIPDESYDNSTWEGGGETTAMDHPGRGDWASDFQNGLTSKGRPTELPGGGMPGPSGY